MRKLAATIDQPAEFSADVLCLTEEKAPYSAIFSAFISVEHQSSKIFLGLGYHDALAHHGTHWLQALPEDDIGIQEFHGGVYVVFVPGGDKRPDDFRRIPADFRV